MNIDFDFYEYAGVIVPGALLAFGGIVLLPDLTRDLGLEDFTFGDFGLFVLVSYAIGQLVQGVGNALETLFWLPFGGLPGKRVLDGETLSEMQRERLIGILREEKLIGDAYSGAEARSVIREMYANVWAAGKSARIDKFNGVYGMLRGMSASLLLLFLASVYVGSDLELVLLLLLALAISMRRMHRFGWHYGREIAVVYLSLRSESRIQA